MILYSLVQLRGRRKARFLALIAVGGFGGLVYAYDPGWGFTSVFSRLAGGQWGPGSWSQEFGALSLFLGALVSAVLGSSFRLVGLSLRPALASFSGGFLMGVGSGLVPGGNDSLMLWSIPGLTLYGPVAYATMILTISALLLAGRSMGPKGDQLGLAATALPQSSA